MNQKNYELLHWAVTQHQFVKSFDPNNAKECYDKVYNSYKRLYDKVINFCVLSDEKEPDEQLPIKQTVTQPVPIKIQNKPIRKAGDKWAVRPWREQRNEHIKKLYMEAKQNRVPIDDGLMKRIAQIAGSTTTKVKEIISLLEFDNL